MPSEELTLPLFSRDGMTKFLKLYLYKMEPEASVSFEDLDLHQSEVERFKKIKSSKKAREFLLSRFLLQKILDSEFEISLQCFRKDLEYPVLENTKIQISMSHSAEFFMFGFSDMKIGVDIETKFPKLDAIELAKKYFSTQEQKLIESKTNQESQKKVFQSLWSLKESYYKYLGQEQSLEMVNELVFDLGQSLDPVKENPRFYYQQARDYSFSFCMESEPLSSEILIMGENVSLSALQSY